MSEWYLEVKYIPPEMSGLPGRKCIIGPIDQINMIIKAVAEGKI